MYLTKFNNKLKKGTANIIDSLIVFKTKDIKRKINVNRKQESNPRPRKILHLRPAIYY